MKTRLIWVDVGMGIMGATFIALLFLRGEDYFVPVMLGFMVVVVIWAVLAELAAVRAERTEFEHSTGRGLNTEPLPR